MFVSHVEMEGILMKKLLTLMALLSLVVFTVGCPPAEDKDGTTPPAADADADGADADAADADADAADAAADAADAAADAADAAADAADAAADAADAAADAADADAVGT